MTRVATAPGVAGLLDAAAEERPDAPALVCGGERVSYEELSDRVDAVTGELERASVGVGDPVGLLLGNGPAWVVAFFAVARAGGVAVPLNPRGKQPELAFCCREAGVRTIVGAEGVRAAPFGPAAPAERADDGAVVLFSSGSTGRPKRVPRSHGALVAEAESVVDGLGLTAGDRIFCAIPLFHTYGLGCALLAAVRAGAALVLLADGQQPFVLQRERALRTIERERATVVPAVPFVLRSLAEAGTPADLSSVRLCLSAATALPRSTYDAFAAAFSVPVRQLYGTTETGAVTANVDGDPSATVASAGRPLPGAAVRVVGAGGAELERGRIGELALRAPGMAAGYAGRDDPLAFRDGCFLSGDRGRVEEDGRVLITGRAKLLIDVRGSDKVDPIEIEDVLAVHPRVREVVVVGAPSGVDGEELVRAVVVPEGPCGTRELVRYCRERLAECKVPRHVAFVDEIPKGPGGKVLRKYLVGDL